MIARKSTTALVPLGLAGLLLLLAPGLGHAQEGDNTRKTTPPPRFTEENRPLTADTLKRLDPKLQAEILDLIRKHLAETRGRGQAPQAERQNPHVAELEQMLRQRMAEIDTIKKQLEEAHARAAGGQAQPKVGDRGDITAHIEIQGFKGNPADIKTLVDQIEKSLQGQQKDIRVQLSVRRSGAPMPGQGPQGMSRRGPGFRKDGVGNAVLQGFGITSSPAPTAPAASPEQRIDMLEKKFDLVLRELQKLQSEKNPPQTGGKSGKSSPKP